MPTRKQRRRAQKERRHEYETVWVDEEGNELDEPPEDYGAAAPEKRDGTRPKPKARAAQQRGGRPLRVPQPPSWQRAAKRSGFIAVALFAVLYLLGSKNGQHNFGTALALAAVYAVLFIPFSYTIDRFAYNRYQRRTGQPGQKGSARKR